MSSVILGASDILVDRAVHGIDLVWHSEGTSCRTEGRRLYLRSLM